MPQQKVLPEELAGQELRPCEPLPDTHGESQVPQSHAGVRLELGQAAPKLDGEAQIE
jgi:hypothetical protein